MLASLGQRLDSSGGGSAADNAKITRDVLEGGKGARREIVALNAGAALAISGEATDLKEGVEKAIEAIDSGRAARKLDEFIRITQRF